MLISQLSKCPHAGWLQLLLWFCMLQVSVYKSLSLPRASAVSDTRYRSFPLAGGEAGAGINSALRPSPAVPSHIPPKAVLPGAARARDHPGAPVLTCAGRSAALCPEPELAGAAPGQLPSPLAAASRLQRSLCPGTWRAPGSQPGSAGDGEGAAP